MLSETVIETSSLSKTYDGSAALNKVSINVAKGDIYGLIGDNGAGKSTLFKILSGLVFPSEGEISLFGAHGKTHIEEQRKRMGVIIEQPGCFPHLSVEKNLEYCRIQKGIPGKDSVEKVLKMVNLLYAKDKKAKELSMGMKQRLGLAIALLGDPELLILDEPISGIDPSGIREIRHLLLKLNQERNMTIVISSHILAELEQLATTYGFLDKGILLEQVTTDELLERCSNYIDIIVSDPERYCVAIEERLPSCLYQVLPDRTLRITNPELGSEVFSNLAVEYDMQIYKLERRRMSLEQYYIDLKERGVA